MGLMHEIMNGPYSYRALREMNREMNHAMAQEYSKQWIKNKMNGKHRNIRSKRAKKK